MLTHTACLPSNGHADTPLSLETRTKKSPVCGVCPACGCCAEGENGPARRYQFSTARGISTWSRCSHCRSYFMLGSYTPDAETEHTRQMAWGQHDAGTRLNDFKSDMFQAVLSRISDFGGRPGQSLLDVGCSFGGFLLQARERGFDGFGIDIVPEAVAYVRSQGFDAEQCDSLEACSLFSADHPVDVLSVLDAHIYWPNQQRELRAAWKLLKPGGLLVMRAITKSPFVTAGNLVRPVLPGLSDRLIRRAVTDHRFCMPLRSLLATIEGCGFYIESASPRGAAHSAESSAAVRALFAAGILSWHLLRFAIAPGALVVARKRAA
ncbi:MAG: methyltransferase domain-containing protein [Planctomycetaceae bacterium]